MLPSTLRERVRRWVLGRPRSPYDPSTRRKLSLVAFFAWVGLGVDGLSSSAYGPEEAFRTLGSQTYLALFLALATAFTVFVISFSYSRIIEHFPHGGGGYTVATSLLSRSAGLVSGCALLVDYALTVSVSIVSGADAIFSFLPFSQHHLKLPLEIGTILLLVLLNLRGIRESVEVVVPFFLLFILTHGLLIGGGIALHLSEFPLLIQNAGRELHDGGGQRGNWGVWVLLFKAFSMGAGTYTGIEAVSNGVGTLQDPKVETGKRTMLYLAVSLAVTAAGLLTCYMLFGVRPSRGQTLNAVLAHAFATSPKLGRLAIGSWFTFPTLLAESVLLVFAAQTGFIDGPRVMANMALDSWLPRRFANLSERLTIQNGILVMGVTSALIVFLAGGRIGILVVMYSVNVFLTFSLSQISMVRFWLRSRGKREQWRKNLAIHSIGFVLCFAILGVMIFEKFVHGAWVTLAGTVCLIGICTAMHRHYRRLELRLRKLEKAALDVSPPLSIQPRPFDPEKRTAIILVGGYHRLGRRCLLTIGEWFPSFFQNVIFASVGVLNSDFFKSEHPLETVERETKRMLEEYVEFAERLGFPARYVYRVGSDTIHELSEICVELSKECPKAFFFAGEIVFKTPRWYHRLLHNDTGYSIQRHIRHLGIPFLLLPIITE